MERKALFGRGSSLLISSPALVLFGAGVLLALRLGSGGVAGGMPVLPPAGAGRPVVGEQSHTRRLHPGGVPRPPALSRAADPAHLPSGEQEGSAADLAGAVPKRPGGGGASPPDDAFESYLQPAPDQEGGARSPPCASPSPLWGSWQTIQVESTWTAQRRGLYRVHRLVARSGTASGWSRGEQPLPAGQIPAIAVYPPAGGGGPLPLSPPPVGTARRPSGVDGGQHRAPGLPGEYQPGDSWKHINWRMAAREQGTPVNLDQTIQPRGLRFLLDGESFCGLSQDWRELEGALEVLASVLSGLSGAGVDCSLSLPPLPPLRSHDRLLRGGRRGRPALLSGGLPLPGPAGPRGESLPQGPAFLPPASPPTRPPSPAPPI